MREKDLRRAVSVFVVTLLLVSVVTLGLNVQLVESSGTIYIRSDGSVEPSDAPISTLDYVTYMLTDDINRSIVVERSNIIIDGNYYMVLGNGSGNGFTLHGLENVTIKNTRIKDFHDGINLEYSNATNILKNNITSCGVWLNRSSCTTISENNITAENGGGIKLHSCSNDTIRDNNMTINAGVAILLESSNQTIIRRNHITANNTGVAIYLADCSNSTVNENNVTADYSLSTIRLEATNYTVLSENRIAGNGTLFGIWLWKSSNSNSVSDNNITSVFFGIYLSGSSNASINGNNITSDVDGIYLSGSSNASITNNNVTTAERHAIRLAYSPFSLLRNNTITSFSVHGDEISDFLNDVDTSNTINSKPIYYWIERNDLTVPADAGYVALINCTRIIVQNLNLINDDVLLAFTTNTTVTSVSEASSISLIHSLNNTITGNNGSSVSLSYSSNNNISENSVHNGSGVSLSYSSNNSICGNNMTDNDYGVKLTDSSNDNIVAGNNMTDNGSGVYVYSSNNNTVTGNSVTNTSYGVQVSDSSINTVSFNNITNSDYGAQLSGSVSNIVIGNKLIGNGYGVQLSDGSGLNTIAENSITDNDYGIELGSMTANNVVNNNNVTANRGYGIYVGSFGFNNITGNNVTANGEQGIHIVSSLQNSVIGNNVTANGEYGILLHSSGDSVFRNNTMINNKLNFALSGSDLSHFVNDVDTSNTVDGKPILYWIDEHDLVVPLNVGYIALVNCTRMAVQNLNVSNNGILLAYTSNTTVTSNSISNASEISLFYSPNNIVTGNYASVISLYQSSNDTITGNNVYNGYGVSLSHSSNNNVGGNNMTDNVYGLRLSSSSTNNIITGNNITNNDYGILLEFSSNNTVSGNNMKNNDYGLKLLVSSNNTVSKNSIESSDYGVQVTDSFFLGGAFVGYFNSISRNNITNNRIGIHVYYTSNNTITENHITNSDYGISLSYADNNSITENNVANNGFGIELSDFTSSNIVSGNNVTANEWSGICTFSSSGNSIIGNNVTANDERGITLGSSTGNLLRNNTMINNKLNFALSGSDLSHFVNDVDTSNTVDGKPIYYWIDKHDLTVPLDAGFVALVNCTRIIVQNLNITNNRNGILLAYTTNTTIANSNINSNDYGIFAFNSSDITIIGNKIADNYGGGICILDSDHNSICQNNVTANGWCGIGIYSSVGNSIFGNNVTAHSGDDPLEQAYGIYLVSSTDNVLRDNLMTSNDLSFGIYVWEPSGFVNDVDTSNTVDGKPIYYWIDKHDLTIPADAGYVALVNCTGIIVQNLNLTHNQNGVFLAYTSNATITNNNVSSNLEGIRLFQSPHNIIRGNNLKTNLGGLYLQKASNCSIVGNHVIDNEGFGVIISSSSNSSLVDNNISGNYWSGVSIYGDSSYNRIDGNNITGQECGIELYSNRNYISGNNIANNTYGVYLYSCLNNSIYHNNFVNNTYHVYDGSWSSTYVPPSTNVWDNGYPLGGNFWSDYNGTDLYHEAYQNETGGDGIGDIPYAIYENNTDNYPLMFPFGPQTQTGENITVFSTHDTALTFDNVTEEGMTVVSETEVGPVPPSGFKLAEHYYNITTTASYSGDVRLRIVYDDSEMTQEEEESLQLMHWNETSQEWIDITIYVDTQNNVVFGETNHLSTFALFTPAFTPKWEISFVASGGYPITDFAVYNGNLYATADSTLYVYNGSSWNAITTPVYVMSLEPYGDKLVVGGKGGLYSYNGTAFTLIFTVPAYIKPLGVYSNTLYAGTVLDNPPILYYCNGSAENPDNWHVDASFSSLLNFSGPFGSIDSFAVFNNRMYVSCGGTVYSYNGTQWSIVKTYGDVYAFLDMEVYYGKLYLATRDLGSRCPLYQGGSGFCGRIFEFNGTDWTEIFDHEYWIYSLETYGDKLYAGTANKIFTYNGTDWDVSFESTEGAYYAISLKTYDDKIYAGMGNGYIFVDPAPEIMQSETVVVPEFPSLIILPLVMLATLGAVLINRRKRVP